jgi:hypothetical protein
MKVIKYGPGWKPHILTCKSCRSELEYTDYDIQGIRRSDYMYPIVGSVNYVMCPVCGLWNILKEVKEYE